MACAHMHIRHDTAFCRSKRAAGSASAAYDWLLWILHEIGELSVFAFGPPLIVLADIACAGTAHHTDRDNRLVPQVQHRELIVGRVDVSHVDLAVATSIGRPRR